MELNPTSLGIRLWALIKSLTKHEKDLFARLSLGLGNTQNQGEEKMYVKLFKAINGQRKYSEAKLRRKFPEIINFSQFLTDLRNRILDSFLWSADDPESRLLKQKVQINKLINTGGDNMGALKLVNETIEEAIAFELYDLLDGLFTCRSKLLLYTEQVDDIEENAAKYQMDTLDASDKAKANAIFRNGWRDYYFLIKEFYISRKDGTEDMVRPLMHHPVLSKEAKAETQTAQIFYHRLRYIVCLFTGNYEGCKVHCLEIERLFEEKPKLIELLPLDFVENIVNTALIRQQLGEDREVVNGILDRLEKIKTKNRRVEAWAFWGRYTTELGYFIDSNPTQSFEIIQILDVLLPKHEPYLSTEGRFVFYYYIGRAYLEGNEMRLSEKWLLKIVDEPSKIRKDLQGMARMLILIGCIDREEDESLIASRCRSYHRWLKIHGLLHETETRMLKFFGGFPYSPNPTVLKGVYQKLANDLDEILQSEFEKRILYLYDFRKWVEKKIKMLTPKAQS